MVAEAHELIRQYAGKNGYKGIEQDVYQLTGGNPYYIKVIFSPTNKFCKVKQRLIAVRKIGLKRLNKE